MEPEGSLLNSQKPATCPYSGPDKFSTCPPPNLFEIHFNIILPSTSGSCKRFLSRKKTRLQKYLDLIWVRSEHSTAVVLNLSVTVNPLQSHTNSADPYPKLSQVTNSLGKVCGYI